MNLTTLDERSLFILERRILERPNAVRVVRLLRELPCVDGRLSSSLRTAEEIPRITAGLAAVTGLAAWLAIGADT